MAQRDNWGWQARIGMFIVGVEAVPEAECWAMAPPNVSIHAARVTAKAPWAAWTENRTSVELADDVIRGARQFAGMRLSTVVLGHSSSSFAGGKGWDEAVVAKLSEQFPEEVRVTTNGLDSLAALEASGIKSPFLVLPAWFNETIIAAGIQYFTDHGYELAGHLQYDPGRKWRDVPPGDLYAQGMGFEQEIEPLYQQIRAACPADADGVLIAGTGFRCVGIIDALEQDLQRPVLTANQVSLWHGLQRTGVRTPVAGFGRLFSL